ncbi:MAG: LamG-like jellyroll fold domain-containing protein [Ignavibacteriaceae bacterium]|jgi:glycerophosphoryl diester phosphodiesterase
MKKWFQLSMVAYAFLLSMNSFAGVKVIAHRGGSYLAPENTASAWNKAVALKADYFELDIQLTSDDSLMIMHDDTVNRTTSGTGSVSSMTYAQLRALDAGSWFNAAFAGEKIPTFSEALFTAKSDPNNIGIVAEIKSSNATIVAKVVKMIQDYGMQSRVVVSSFNFAQISQVKSLDTTISVQLFGTITNFNIDQVANIGGEWVGSGGTTTQAIIDYAHSKNVLYNAWTINSAAQMIPLIKTTIVDGITTDAPDVLIALADDTPPTDVALNTTVISETRVTLNWQPAEDLQSGISNYLIYRDGVSSPTTLLATVGNVTQFTDETYIENQSYYYRVKAKNNAGILSANYSNEVTATTGVDITKPSVSFVSSSGDTATVVVEFSERVDKTTAETPANYTINKSVMVLSAKLLLDSRQVLLTTTQLGDTTYTITVKNVLDKAITPNKMVTSSTIFLHHNLTSDVVAFYKLDETEIVGVDTLAKDATVNANNGVTKNGPVISEGFLGNAMEFDGVDDYVQFQPSASFDISTGLVSVSVWTKLKYLPADLPAAFGPIFDSETDNYVIYEDRGNNQLRFKVATSGGAARPAINAADLKTGEWIHVVGVYDGVNAKIYMNGLLKGTLPLTGTVNKGQVATLGKSGTSFFSGKIDNVLVLNKALTYQEVIDLYNKTKAAGESPNPTDVVLNAPVVNETDVTLSWTPAVTFESAMMGYEVYRDATPEAATLIATVAGNQTQFTDETNIENGTFYYRIKAKNSVALKSLNFSNEATANTATDTKAPNIVYLTAKEKETKVVAEFNELVDKTSAENIANYAIDNSAQTVISAKVALDGKTVILTTTPLTAAVHQLGISNIKDKAATPNVSIVGSAYDFTFTPHSSDIVAYYSMDDTRVDTLFDATANTNNGIFMSTTSVAPGFSGNSLMFNGTDDYVLFTQSPSFDIPGGLVSVSVWMKLEYLPTEMLLGTGPLFDSHDDQYVMYEDKGNKELRFKVTSTAGAARPGIPQVDLITGQWINAVGVFDGTNAMIYLNGVKKGTLPLTGTVKPGQVAMLGKSAASGTISFFKGKIDNVAIFKKALSQTEVEDLYTTHKITAKNLVSVDEVKNTIPNEFALSQNYPNPFNPETRLSYQLPVTGKVSLKVFDILGREVATLVDEVKEAGTYQVSFNAKAFASGAYFYRFQSGDFVKIKKMVLLK